jgi:hypothetical protein
MAKRFTDTEIWQEDWFISLSEGERAFWFYLKDVCDCAGIWRPNISLANHLYGFKVDLASTLSKINTDRDRIKVLNNGRWFLVGFIPFQYGRVLNKTAQHIEAF